MAPMSGQKRTRPRAETEDIEIDSASSQFQHSMSGRKRARISPIGISEAEPDSDDSDTLDDYRHDNESDNDEAVLREVAEIRRRIGDRPENHAADNAIIEEVSCTNFMCHSRLTVTLGPLINFIIGHNGSGKSAVLTALQLCLGGKASGTGRGGSLKAFIKEGTEHAMLKVRIKNEGDNAYQPDVYGRSIIVQRNFSRTGTSGFKLMNENEKIVSTKKSDLEDILDAFVLQMDNPMNVLTQDMARQFLNSSNSAEKYKFFYMGTHLEQLDSDYRILAESLQSNNEQSHNLRESLAEAEKRYRAIEKKISLHEKANNLHEQVRRLGRQMAWAQVEEQEKELAEIEGRAREEDDTIKIRSDATERQAERLEEAVQAKLGLESDMQELVSERVPKTEQLEAVKEKFDEKKKELYDIQSELREINGSLASETKKVASYEEKIAEEREKIANADDGRHAQKMEAIQAGKQQLETLKDDAIRLSSESRALDVAVQTAEQEMIQRDQAKGTKANNIKDVENRIRNLQSESGNWQSAFDQNLPRLLKTIDQETRFRVKPVGPMGRYAALLKPQWSNILEKSAGGLLDGFAVTSKADQAILSELMRRCSYKGQIYVGSASPMDTSRHEPPEELDTWLRVLKFDNDLVRNTMIVNQGIEQTVLEADSQKATELLSQNIPHVKQIFAIQPPDGSGKQWGQRFAKSGTGAEQVSPIQPFAGRARMQTDKASRVTLEKETLATLKSDQISVESVYREARSKHTRAKQAVEKHRRDMNALTREIERQDDAVKVLEDALEEATPQTGTLEEYEKELADAKSAQAMYKNTYQDVIVAKDQLNREQRVKKAEMDAISVEIAELDEKIEKVKLRIEKAEAFRETVVREKNEAYASLEDAKDVRAHTEQELQAQVAVVSDITAKAEAYCQRVLTDPGDTADLIDAKLRALNKQIERHNREVGDNIDVLTLKKLEEKRFLEQRRDAYSQHENILTALKQALADRQERWRQFRKHIVVRAKGMFTYLLNARQFRGELVVDHNAKVLEIKVQPDATKKSDKGRQTKTLSGGEKSFSTICLLLALWEAMGSPIRCLDEFDVFMDSVNRDISMKMMIEAARNAVSRQFILITPQAMGNVHLGPDVKIHKMRDPERGQTTLAF